SKWAKRKSSQSSTARRPLRRCERKRCRPALEALESRWLPSVTLKSSFLGMDVNNGGGGVPPDVNGAASATRMIEAVNSSIAIYDKSGAKLFQMNVDSFFGTGASGFASDPIVVYDDI